MTRPAALVTGGARRIGEAIVRRFAAEGWHVVIHCHTATREAAELASVLSSAEVITCDLSLETRALPDLKMGISHCENIKDYVTRELFVDILESEEEHIDWLQTQMRLIEQMGIENFVQLQTRPNQAS